MVDLAEHSMEERARSVGCPVIDFDIEDGRAFRENVYGAFDAARELAPFFYSKAARGFWVFSDYSLIAETNKRPDLFSNNAVEVFLREEHLMPPMIPEMVDPPEHHQYRMALAPLFTPKAVTAFEHVFRELCVAQIERLASATEFDFMEAFARPVPSGFFLGLMGVPDDKREGLTDALIRATFTTASEDPSRSVRRSSTEQVIKAVLELVKDHREHDHDDVFARLMLRPAFGRLLDDEELFRIAVLLVNAGVETTGGALGYMFEHLARHPDDRQAIVDDPDLIPSAVEELLRLYPVANSNRIVTGDEDFLGCPVRKGDRVVINRIGANRDPSLIPDGAKVLLGRNQNNHTTFGNGIHTCLGSHLARREIRITLEEWHKRIPNYRLSPDHVPHHHVGSTISLSSLRLQIE
ncbi:cytochrome P450 [Novosphingobium sp. PASSN1]|uniref:cytochrome P450 n=1 Tax=Novosphingobium sp. PASSN1 TaxID=2015561 RepID=UPI0025E5EB46|nr:cytochrome P450 [Novosphingobium sp. PASSN1]